MTLQMLMRRTGVRRLAVCSGMAALVAASALSQQAAHAPRDLVLTVGKSVLVNSATPIERIAVGFGDVAEARAISPQEALIDGKAPGQTSLIIWQQGGNKLFFDVTVRPNTSNVNAKLEKMRQKLQELLPGQGINASFDNDTVFLTGTAKDLVSVERAVAIASTVGKVANLLYVDVPPTETQILLKVQFATVDRRVSTELGVNILSTGAANTIGRTTTGQFAPPTVSVDPQKGPTFTLSDALNVFLFRPDLNLGATIKALQTRGMFEILAEPNVLAINGKQASFLAGGEFPYPILQGGGLGIGTVTVQFREFGVRINFLPLITPRGTIRLDVAPEVSALDFTSGLTFQGVNIPGLSTRRVHTEIELESGQSFAIGGLMDRRLTETLQKVPLLASVPVLGKLFQSRSTARENNELLVIVTPEIIRPMPAGQARPQLQFPIPLMGTDPASQTSGPSGAGTAENPPSAPIPFEKLMQSMKDQGGMKLEGKDLGTSTGIQPALPNLSPPSAAAAPSMPPVK
jgi:pilus assembly protein CpaC